MFSEKCHAKLGLSDISPLAVSLRIVTEECLNANYATSSEGSMVVGPRCSVWVYLCSGANYEGGFSFTGKTCAQGSCCAWQSQSGSVDTLVLAICSAMYGV